MSLPATSTLAALRYQLAAIEAAGLPRARRTEVSPLAGLLRCCSTIAALPGALHEVAAPAEPDMAAASGFVLALAAWVANGGAAGAASGVVQRTTPPAPPAPRTDGKTVLWVAEDMALAESGAPYGPGLEDFGLKPEQLIRIAVARERAVLWAMEEALRCRGVGAVIGEIRGRDIGLTESRRLALAGGRTGAAAFLLRAAPRAAPLAAATRWIVGAAPSRHNVYGPGPPRLLVHLTRNRRGSQGSWVLEWNSGEQRFDLAADRQPVAAADGDRPPRAAAGD